ncbi:hypothetical protein [Dongia sp.]|uniref:hypothetical protein n=1 Tax=Dongia sp. TaxID=1977262 RepID=UPI0037512257
MEDSFRYRGFDISVSARRLLNGRYRTQHVVVPMTDEAFLAAGGVPRLASAMEVPGRGTDPKAQALQFTIAAAKAFVEELYKTKL